ncbi:glycosyltransferase, partial [Vagococcus salmoninarum]
MKIGFFTDTYFPQVSGVATSIKTLKEELEKRGHDVFIFTTSDPKADEAELGIIRMPSIPFISFKDRRVVVSGMIDAYEKAKKYHLDIIHTHTEFGTGWLGKYIAKRLKIPVVHTYHTMYEDYLHYIAHGKLIRPYHVKQASRAFCRNASGIVCPSERVVTKLEQYNIQAPL